MTTGSITPSEHDEQLALEAAPLDTLLRQLAIFTRQEREMSAALKVIKDHADKIEAVVLQRMINDGIPSMTVAIESDNPMKMKFTISSRSFPRMVQGSLVAAQAIEAYAARLMAAGRLEEADMFMDMLTIKGTSLEPVLREWLMNDVELPPEFDGAIEPSTRFSLSKTKG